MNRVVFGSFIILCLLFISSITGFIQLVKAQETTITINADGSITPPTAPISTVDNITYTFTGNMSYPTYDGIIIERNNIVINGNGYTVQGDFNLSTENDQSVCLNLTDTSNVLIENTNIQDFCYAIYLSSSNNNTVSGNNATADGYGIELEDSNNTMISGNNATSGYDGIQLVDSSSMNNITGNSVTNNDVIGIQLWGYCNNNSISGNNITNCDDGIELVYGDGNSISGNNITNCDDGIDIIISSNDTINGNNITNNQQKGIWISDSNSSSITGNNLVNGLIGINLFDESFNNVISCNNITANNWYGIWAQPFSSNNEIYHNNFFNNSNQASDWWGNKNAWDDGYASGGNYWSDYNGTDLYSGPYQNITGSDGIGDTPYTIPYNQDNYPLMNPYVIPSPPTCDLIIGATTGGTTNPNVGTHTYAAGSSVHVEAYANASYDFDHWELDSTDVGSANPYTVLMADDHTLTAVFTFLPPPLIVSISPARASFYVGRSVAFTSNVSGGIAPYSYQWYLNGSAVSGANSSTWTFASQSMGNYSVYLNVTDSLGNKALSDQASVTVVHLLGDLNNDGKVDIKDIHIAALAYGSVGPNYYYQGSPASSNWNPNADVNGDGKVDIRDIALIAKNYGQHYP